jgi:hypothetical protein
MRKSKKGKRPKAALRNVASVNQGVERIQYREDNKFQGKQATSLPAGGTGIFKKEAAFI